MLRVARRPARPWADAGAARGADPLMRGAPTVVGSRFIGEMGSTKLFARLRRFQMALDHKRASRARWLDVAHDLGYFDQMHMVKEFRAFGGEVPQVGSSRVVVISNPGPSAHHYHSITLRITWITNVDPGSARQLVRCDLPVDVLNCGSSTVSSLLSQRVSRELAGYRVGPRRCGHNLVPIP